MRRFADLCLKPNPNDRDQPAELIVKAKELGYRLVGMSLPQDAKRDTWLFLRDTCKEHSIDFATRVDLTPRSPDDLLRSLRRFRRKYELVAVNCVSKAVARQAAKDHRVDLIAFPSCAPRERFFDRAEARVASEGVAALEIDMSMLLQTSGYFRARLLSCLRRELAIAKKADIPVVISSHAADKFQLRGPRDFASFATLLGLGSVSALDAVSTVPVAIVKRNREKLDPSYVAAGIRVVRRSKDCDT